MPTTEQEKVPLAEAWRIATGQEPPPPMTADEREQFEAWLERGRRERLRIYRTIRRPA